MDFFGSNTHLNLSLVTVDMGASTKLTFELAADDDDIFID